MRIRIQKDERTKDVICENCKREHNIKIGDMKLVVAYKSYTLYSWKCPCCGKNDYARDNFF